MRGEEHKAERGAAVEGRPALAVVMKGWPRLSETFIAQELALLEARGWRFEIWALRRPHDGKTHPLHDQVTASAHYLPEYLHRAPLRVALGLIDGLGRRRFWPAFRAFLRDLRRDFSRNRVRRFGQALVLARELPLEARALYVHFMHTPASAARYAALLRDIPWAFSAHAKDIWTTEDWEKREKLADASFAATCTAYGAAELRRLAAEPERVSLIYHGLDLGRFPPPPERAAGGLRLLSVGRLVEKKGYDRLIAALARLPATLDWRFEHIGGGDLARPLRAEAERLGIADRIEWLGAQAQGAVIEAMRRADLFVLPSRVAASGDRDGLPNVLMEAASQKLPILSTPVAAIPEFVRDGLEGRLVEDAPESLAAAIAAMAADPEGRAAMAEAAYARLRAEFGADDGVTALARRLDGLMAEAERRAAIVV